MPTIGYTKGDTGTKKKSTKTIDPPQSITPLSATPIANAAGTPGAGAQGTTYAANANQAAAASTPGGYSYPTGGRPSQGTNPYTGFASRYNPGALQEQIWRDPQMVLNSMFGDSGQSIYSPMYSTMRDFYGADPQSLWLLTAQNRQGKFGDAGDYANFLNSMYGNYMSPGGRAFDFGEILNNLMGLQDQSQLSPTEQSPLWQVLNSGNASDQARTLYGLIGDAAKVGLSPAIASAFLNSLATQSDSYLAQNGTTAGGAGPFYQWFQNPMMGR